MEFTFAYMVRSEMVYPVKEDRDMTKFVRNLDKFLKKTRGKFQLKGLPEKDSDWKNKKIGEYFVYPVVCKGVAAKSDSASLAGRDQNQKLFEFLSKRGKRYGFRVISCKEI